MRFGLVTPMLTLVPNGHAAWEETAGASELRQIVIAADRLGYHHLTCSDHVAIPAAVATVRGSRYFDPFSTLGFVAGVTTRIRLATHVLVLPYYHPLEVAKRLGTLDVLSGGRVIAGVGVGTLREEFQLLGAEFDGRGARYEDALRALRAALGSRQPEYQGSHFSFRDFVVDPCAQQSRMPIWVGGRTPRSLRRALIFGDGWAPFGFSQAQLAELLERARRWPVWTSRRAAFDLVLNPERLVDVRTPDEVNATVALLARYRQLGATALNLQFRTRSVQDYLDQLDTFMAKVAPQLS